MPADYQIWAAFQACLLDVWNVWTLVIKHLYSSLTDQHQPLVSAYAAEWPSLIASTDVMALLHLCDAYQYTGTTSALLAYTV